MKTATEILNNKKHTLTEEDGYGVREVVYETEVVLEAMEEYRNQSPPSAVSTDGAKGIEKLLSLLSEKGGEIVSTASLDINGIEQARASKRLYVDENSLGYVWLPDINKFPETDEEVKEFEKWYPLHVPMPESLKNWNPTLPKIVAPQDKQEVHCRRVSVKERLPKDSGVYWIVGATPSPKDPNPSGIKFCSFFSAKENDFYDNAIYWLEEVKPYQGEKQ